MSQTFEYRPQGVCSRMMTITYEGDTIEKLEVMGGCNGNSKGIAALVAGRKMDEIIAAVEGTTCGFKSTSCPDQLACALREIRSSQQ